MRGFSDDLGPDISTVQPDLRIPELSPGPPQPGKRVKQTIPGYPAKEVHHTIYLPVDWTPQGNFPVLVEYAGNGPYQSNFGDISTGLVEDSKLGFGISQGKRFIWICLPYLNAAGSKNVTRWWGDSPQYDVSPTVSYCKNAVPWLCKTYGGDPQRVILCGFSRGAIACNFVGLYDDQIAALWCGFVVYSHYDGVFTGWRYPGADRRAALERLNRLQGRPQFVCQETTANSKTSLTATQNYLHSTSISAPFIFASTGFRNHNDAWVLRPSNARQQLREWVDTICKPPK
ncbi:MAG: hypothetical protein MK165_01830 [Pirellulaceae bacterium]|nr:hypothetical protein [Pirellulaceae bacterium]